jgi:prepilin-type N-terminal cleavage/methylation domain-containing protein
MKKNHKTKRRAVTLIEMIVVMLLIATITGALAYNYNASLNEGKVFKTKEGMSRIKTILSMVQSEHSELSGDEVASNWDKLVVQSPLAGKASDLLKDGWGKPYKVSYRSDSDEFEIESEGLNAYKLKKQNS